MPEARERNVSAFLVMGENLHYRFGLSKLTEIIMSGLLISQYSSKMDLGSILAV